MYPRNQNQSSNLLILFLTSFYCGFGCSTTTIEQNDRPLSLTSILDDNSTMSISTTVIPMSISSISLLDDENRTISSSLSSLNLNKTIQISQNGQQSQHHHYSEPYIYINGREWTVSNFRPSTQRVMIDNSSMITFSNSSLSSNKCVDGETFWNERTGKCQQCTAGCPSGAMVSRPCNRTHNLECVCAKGSYMSIVDGTCKPCSECPSGYGVWRTCRWSRNTVCRQCQPGTYSGVAVGTLGCIPCSKCGPNQEMISGCDGNRDTVCIDRSALVDSYLNSIDDGQLSMLQQQPLYYTKTNGGSSSSSSSSSTSSSSSSSSSMSNFDRIANSHGHHALPFYIAMLVAIVFFFCLYVLIQLRCNNGGLMMNHRALDGSLGPHHHTKLIPATNTNVNLRSPTMTSISACPHHQSLSLSYNIPSWAPPPPDPTLPYHSITAGQFHFNDSVMPLFPTTNNRKLHRTTPSTKYTNKTYYELLLDPKYPKSTKSTESLMIQSVPLISDDVQHLTIEIRQTLENLLGKDSESWRLLAKELGYDEKHIVQFEAKAATMSNGRTMVDTFKVIRLLLLDWSSQMTTSPDESSKLPQSQNNNKQGPPSLATLTNALIRIGRVDCARVCVRQNHHQFQMQNHKNPLPSSRQ